MNPGRSEPYWKQSATSHGTPEASATGQLWSVAKGASLKLLLVHSPKVEWRRESGFTEWFHIALPLRGSFLWQDSKGDVLAGQNHALVVPSGREFRISHPVTSDLSLVIAPRRSELDRIARLCNADLHEPSARILSAEAQLVAHRLIWAARTGAPDLALEELALSLITALGDGQPQSGFDATARRVVTRAKEYIHATLDQPVTLGDVAAAVGTNAVYLTNLFKAKEGIPLHKYLLWLRLASGLANLPHAPDLSALAHDLGFSSHSHLSSAFKSRFKQSPSQIRLGASGPSQAKTFDVLPLCAARAGAEASLARSR